MTKPEKMNLKRFVNDFTIPVLKEFKLYKPSRVKLIGMTANTESGLFKYTRQIGIAEFSNVGGFGYIQMELATYYDIWENFLRYRKKLANKIIKKFFKHFSGTLEAFLEFEVYKEDAKFNLRTNPYFQSLFCALHYLRVPAALPNYEDDIALAQYWKKHYNTELGKGTVEHCLNLWEVSKNQFPNLQ